MSGPKSPVLKVLVPFHKTHGEFIPIYCNADERNTTYSYTFECKVYMRVMRQAYRPANYKSRDRESPNTFWASPKLLMRMRRPSHLMTSRSFNELANCRDELRCLG